MTWLFWASVAWIVYAYAGYPVALAALSLLRGRTVRRADVLPPLSVVVTVHNGAAEIRRKLSNLLEQDYPRDRMEILVADDGSDDGTDRIVREEFSGLGVRLVRLETRGGKERAQRNAVAAAGGEVLVFTDVGTLLDRRGLATIVRSFADPSVGAVSSEDRMLEDGGRPSGGESRYVSYEMKLRRLESRIGSVVGLSGSFFAARREVCEDFSDRLASDFRTALLAVRLGFRAVADEEAIGFYRDVGRREDEFDRKVRTVVRGLTVLFAEISMSDPLRHGLFAWQLLSHKVGRWAVPFAMIGALASSGALAVESGRWAAAFVLQLAGYGLAFAAARPPLARLAPARALRYLVETNLAILVAWGRYVRGDRIVAWSPSAR